ncbi:MAG: hypothetical protein K8823_1300 [Cenarchaeum symbiont of Oopsacas minuta]|nr:hypothetical protein [Cenarchaeum symbiont of Oopsacas minuta]
METSSPKVTRILDALSKLETNLDSLESSVQDMKKSINTKAQSEIESVTEKMRKDASDRAQQLIEDARNKAKLESENITKNGQIKLKEIHARIESESASAVEYIVSTVLKPA